jgi:hypothetical protein
MRDFLGWDAEFADPQTTVLVVANFKPNHDTARNIFQEDKHLISAAAAKHGFVMIEGPKSKHVRFKRQSSILADLRVTAA